MYLPVLFIVLVLSFPLSSINLQNGQNDGDYYDFCSVLDSKSFKIDSVLYNSDSVSDNIPDDSENQTFEGVTSEQFINFSETLKNDLENVKENEIEQNKLLSKIFELITYISGFLLFGVLVLLLTVIYKFFKMFF